jgi:hypothetical protein
VATAKPMNVALAWLLQRSPNILLIPGTSSELERGLGDFEPGDIVRLNF